MLLSLTTQPEERKRGDRDKSSGDELSSPKEIPVARPPVVNLTGDGEFSDGESSNDNSEFSNHDSGDGNFSDDEPGDDDSGDDELPWPTKTLGARPPEVIDLTDDPSDSDEVSNPP